MLALYLTRQPAPTQLRASSPRSSNRHLNRHMISRADVSVSVCRLALAIAVFAMSITLAANAPGIILPFGLFPGLLKIRYVVLEIACPYVAIFFNRDSEQSAIPCMEVLKSLSNAVARRDLGRHQAEMLHIFKS